MTLAVKIQNTKLILLLAMLFALPSLSANDTSVFNDTDVLLRVYGSIIDNDNNAKLEECVVKVLQNGTFSEFYFTNSRGRYDFLLPSGYDYSFYYEKPGYVSKSIEIDSKQAMNMDDQFIYILKADIALFPELPNIDYSILKNPIGKGYCDEISGSVVFDEGYTKDMTDKVSKLYKPKSDTENPSSVNTLVDIINYSRNNGVYTSSMHSAPKKSTPAAASITNETVSTTEKDKTIINRTTETDDIVKTDVKEMEESFVFESGEINESLSANKKLAKSKVDVINLVEDIEGTSAENTTTKSAMEVEKETVSETISIPEENVSNAEATKSLAENLVPDTEPRAAENDGSENIAAEEKEQTNKVEITAPVTSLEDEMPVVEDAPITEAIVEEEVVETTKEATSSIVTTENTVAQESNEENSTEAAEEVITNEVNNEELSSDLTTEEIAEVNEEESMESPTTIAEPEEIKPASASTPEKAFEAAPSNNGIVWRVQLGAFRNNNIAAFYGISNVDFITGKDGITRCVAGLFDTPQEAAKHKLELIERGYKDAFIIAFRGNERVDIKKTGADLGKVSYTKLRAQMTQ